MKNLESGLQCYMRPDQLEALAAQRVGIIGAGGLGSNVALMLVRSGVRQLTIADHDRVEPSNLNRQMFWPEDIGMFKVVMLGRLLRRLEPKLDISLQIGEVKEGNARDFFGSCSVIVEAVDKPETKAMLCRVFKKSAALLVTASGIAGNGGLPMEVRRLADNLVCVGDFSTDVDEKHPPMAPRVTMAAALQAEVVIDYLLKDNKF